MKFSVKEGITEDRAFQPISFPFIWRGWSGAMWLRTSSGEDVCLKDSANKTYVMGNRSPRDNTSDVIAWSRRLGNGEYLTITVIG